MMLDYDVVGFQARQHLHDFEDCLRNFLNIARQSGEPIWFEGRPVIVGTFPIGIDSRAFARQAKKAAGSIAGHRLLESIAGRSFMIGVDRLDYSKGLPNRFEAFGYLLDRFPEHRMHVTYLQIAARSREDVAEYQRLKRELDRLSGEINGRYADFDWQPLRYMTRAVSRAKPCRISSTGARRPRHAAARWHEPRRQGICRGARSRTIPACWSSRALPARRRN